MSSPADPTPTNGIAWVEIKFRHIAAVAVPPSETEELIGLVETIERQPVLSRLATLIAAAA